MKITFSTACYEVFRRMLAAGNPPDDWAALVTSARPLPGEIEAPLADRLCAP